MMKHLKITLLLQITLIGWKSYAQDKENKLDPVTLTASLNEANTSKTGRNIIVVNGDQFSNLPVHSIDDLLRYVPGMEVQQRGPFGSQSDIVLRGATFQQVLVILDGVRINDPNTGHFTSYIPIAPSEIERIEILKGPSSATYGSEAVGGVINIITKSFGSKKNQSTHQMQAQGAIGEYGLINTNIGGFVQRKNLSVAGGLLINSSDGQPQRGTNGFFNNRTASLSLHQVLNNNWNIAIRSSLDNRKFSAQNFYTSFVSDTAQEEVKTFWNQLKLDYQKQNNKLSLDLGYKQTKDWYEFNSGITPNQNTSRLFQSLITFQHSINSRSQVTTGAQFQNKSIRSSDRGNNDVKQAAAFIILNQAFAQNLRIAPALRLDYDQRGGTELVPQVNISYRKNTFQFRGAAGKTIRQADFTERFNNYNKSFVSSGSIGNPDLVAERSFSYEAGADYFLHSVLKISSTVFRRDQKNVVDWVVTPYNQMPRKENLSPTGNYALATNVASVHTTGFETDIQFNKTISNKQSVWATLGLSWLHTQSSEQATSFYISSHAKFLGNLSLNYQQRRLAFNATALYKERDPMAANAINVKVDKRCFMLNLKADYSLIENRFGCFIEADNVLNNSCRDLLGSLKPARWLMAGLKLNIDR